MLRQKLSDASGYHQATPRKSYKGANESDYPALSERKIALYCLLLSLFVVACKVWYLNGDYVKQQLFERRLVSYETITEDGEVMFRYVWKSAVRFSRFWLPVLCGFLTTTFTWLMVFLDSNVPGVSPPSPFSPSKYKVNSRHAFHLNYVFAVAIGVAVAGYMYWRGVSIEF